MVIGGIGLGLSYISLVSTLIIWFPDHRGMATGMAIMGFGGGAMIGSPLAVMPMNYYASASSMGVTQTFMVMALGYFIYMMAGAFSCRTPATDWKPTDWTPPLNQVNNAMITTCRFAKKLSTKSSGYKIGRPEDMHHVFVEF